ncbi:hypothetical protein GEMRC1_002269 [Eukaryota sp. GEM-RC1]
MDDDTFVHSITSAVSSSLPLSTEVGEWLLAKDPTHILALLSQAQFSTIQSPAKVSLFHKVLRFSPASLIVSPTIIRMQIRQLGVATLTITGSSWSRSDLQIKTLSPHHDLSLTVSPSAGTTRKNLPCTITVTAKSYRPSTTIPALLFIKSPNCSPVFVPVFVSCQRSIFGSWLEFLPTSSSGVPLCFEQLLSLFETAPASDMVKTARAFLQNSDDPTIDPPPCLLHPHTVATVIKQFFRELPDDLTLIPDHPVCLALGKCLAEVARNQEVTKMSVHALAICIGPNVYRDKEGVSTLDSMGSASSTSTVFLSNLIEQFV